MKDALETDAPAGGNGDTSAPMGMDSPSGIPLLAFFQNMCRMTSESALVDIASYVRIRLKRETHTDYEVIIRPANV